MTTYFRDGHYRRSVYGDYHWVEGHYVTRDDWSSSGNYTSLLSSLTSTSGFRSASSPAWIDPTARCPICGAEVFFYSNDFGSRVYFDDLGPPWPKHPCTDTTIDRYSIAPRLSTRADTTNGFRDRVIYDRENAQIHLPGVFVVTEIIKRGSKRVVTLHELGGERIEVLLSPPTPPQYAIAVDILWELHWFDPESETHGKNYVWKRGEEIG